MSKLSERMEAARDFWVDLPTLGPGRRVKLRRPPAAEILRMSGGVLVEHVKAAAVGWEGITEADLLGPEVGASDPAPFDADAWGVLASDSVPIGSACAGKLAESITAYLAKAQETRGN